MWSARLFVTTGGGTPDPNNPPAALVQEGPYRYSRNPMVVGAMGLLVGIALLARSILVLTYSVAFALVLNFYCTRTEEPELLERFGRDYTDYQRRVPRWLPLG
jgi:protein-S-isoprenylcysteine O-methyltransferase Ste14